MKVISRADGVPRRLLRGAAMALGAAAVTVAASGTPAVFAHSPEKDQRTGTVQHDVPKGFGSWQEFQRSQNELVNAADRITLSAKRQNGFAGIVLAPEKRTLRLYWKGRVPDSVDTVVTSLNGRVTVERLPARHSARELAAEVTKVTRRAGGVITSVAPAADGSGLDVTTDSTERAARAAVRDVRVPVKISTGVQPTFTSRWNDSPPWWGGAAWRNANTGGGCSTGFAVWHGGVTRMLSAGHCGNVGQTATDPTGEVMGPISQDNDSLDVLLIDARSGGRVYNNQVDNVANEFSNPVAGATGSYVGLWVCTSGAYSGTRCRIQVKQVNVNIYIGYWVYNTVMAEQVDHTVAVGQGDSGGSVEVVGANSTVYAAGVNSAIDLNTEVPCTGYRPTGRRCAWRMFYAPWASAVNAFGVSIVTG